MKTHKYQSLKDAPLPSGEGLGERVRRARALRKHMTLAEHLLWQALRNHQLRDMKFRRQHPIGAYIVDFYCHAARLVVEVDGDYHQLQAQRECDEVRTRALNGLGLKVLRFDNAEVEHALHAVLATIAACLAQSPR